VHIRIKSLCNYILTESRKMLSQDKQIRLIVAMLIVRGIDYTYPETDILYSEFTFQSIEAETGRHGILKLKGSNQGELDDKFYHILTQNAKEAEEDAEIAEMEFERRPNRLIAFTEDVVNKIMSLSVLLDFALVIGLIGALITCIYTLKKLYKKANPEKLDPKMYPLGNKYRPQPINESLRDDIWLTVSETRHNHYGSLLGQCVKTILVFTSTSLCLLLGSPAIVGMIPVIIATIDLVALVVGVVVYAKGSKIKDMTSAMSAIDIEDIIKEVTPQDNEPTRWAKQHLCVKCGKHYSNNDSLIKWKDNSLHIKCDFDNVDPVYGRIEPTVANLNLLEVHAQRVDVTALNIDLTEDMDALVERYPFIEIKNSRNRMKNMQESIEKRHGNIGSRISRNTLAVKRIFHDLKANIKKIWDQMDGRRKLLVLVGAPVLVVLALIAIVSATIYYFYVTKKLETKWLKRLSKIRRNEGKGKNKKRKKGGKNKTRVTLVRATLGQGVSGMDPSIIKRAKKAGRMVVGLYYNKINDCWYDADGYVVLDGDDMMARELDDHGYNDLDLDYGEWEDDVYGEDEALTIASTIVVPDIAVAQMAKEDNVHVVNSIVLMDTKPTVTQESGEDKINYGADIVSMNKIIKDRKIDGKVDVPQTLTGVAKQEFVYKALSKLLGSHGVEYKPVTARKKKEKKDVKPITSMITKEAKHIKSELNKGVKKARKDVADAAQKVVDTIAPSNESLISGFTCATSRDNVIIIRQGQDIKMASKVGDYIVTCDHGPYAKSPVGTEVTMILYKKCYNLDSDAIAGTAKIIYKDPAVDIMVIDCPKEWQIASKRYGIITRGDIHEPLAILAYNDRQFEVEKGFLLGFEKFEMQYDINTYGGTSGSAVYNRHNHVIGVHTGTHDDKKNRGTFFTEEMLTHFRRKNSIPPPPQGV